MTSEHAAEINSGTRFAFGENWARFLLVLNEERIQQAEKSLRQLKTDGGSIGCNEFVFEQPLTTLLVNRQL